MLHCVIFSRDSLNGDHRSFSLLNLDQNLILYLILGLSMANFLLRCLLHGRNDER